MGNILSNKNNSEIKIGSKAISIEQNLEIDAIKEFIHELLFNDNTNSIENTIYKNIILGLIESINESNKYSISIKIKAADGISDEITEKTDEIKIKPLINPIDDKIVTKVESVEFDTIKQFVQDLLLDDKNIKIMQDNIHRKLMVILTDSIHEVVHSPEKKIELDED